MIEANLGIGKELKPQVECEQANKVRLMTLDQDQMNSSPCCTYSVIENASDDGR